MTRFIITGETPSKKNSRIVLPNGRNIPGKRYQQWHVEAKRELGAQMLIAGIKEPIKNKVCINLTFQHGDLRRRDSDNGTSSILDLLCDVGILEDDNWQVVEKLQISNVYAKNKPLCTIEIEQL